MSNPPDRPLDGKPRKTGGLLTPPAPSATPANCISCAAQNAARVILPLGFEVVGVERLAREALADTGSSIIGVDCQLSAPDLGQPPLFVTAPLAASAVSELELKPRWKTLPRRRGFASKNAIRIRVGSLPSRRRPGFPAAPWRPRDPASRTLLYNSRTPPRARRGPLSRRPWRCQSRARLVVARSSQALLCWRRAVAIAVVETLLGGSFVVRLGQVQLALEAVQLGFL